MIPRLKSSERVPSSIPPQNPITLSTMGVIRLSCRVDPFLNISEKLQELSCLITYGQSRLYMKRILFLVR